MGVSWSWTAGGCPCSCSPRSAPRRIAPDERTGIAGGEVHVFNGAGTVDGAVVAAFGEASPARIIESKFPDSCVGASRKRVRVEGYAHVGDGVTGGGPEADASNVEQSSGAQSQYHSSELPGSLANQENISRSARSRWSGLAVSSRLQGRARSFRSRLRAASAAASCG